MERQFLADDTVDVKVDQLFDALAHERRRYVLSCLDEHEHPVAQSDLAEEVVARETGGETSPTRSEVAAVNRSLKHIHMPKLVAAGLVEYDQDANQVELVAQARPLWEPLKRLASQ